MLTGPPSSADEANKLTAWENQVDVDLLLSFAVAVTRQQQLAHFVLATSDFFFMSWLESGRLCAPPPSSLGGAGSCVVRRRQCAALPSR